MTLHVLHDAYRDGRVMSDHLPLLVVLALNTPVHDKDATNVVEGGGEVEGEDADWEDEDDALAAAIALSLKS